MVQQVGHEEDHPSERFRPGKVLALVGGEPIFVGDLMFKINQIIEEKDGRCSGEDQGATATDGDSSTTAIDR